MQYIELLNELSVFSNQSYDLLAQAVSDRGSVVDNYHEEEELPVFIMLIVFILLTGVFILFLSILYSFFKLTFKSTFFRLGLSKFSKFYKSTPANKRFAYKVIGCHMIQAERGGGAAQYRYLFSYLQSRYNIKTKLETRYITILHKDFDDIRLPLLWLKSVEPKEEYIKLIDFLANLAFFNDRLTKGEMNLIYKAGDILEIPRTEVKSIITIRFNRQQRAREEQQKKRTTYTRSRTSTKQNKHNKLKVLGVHAQNASFDEVRKAYRRLAAQHHPDRFFRASKEDQERAHERFIEIKLAYEYLEKIMS